MSDAGMASPRQATVRAGEIDLVMGQIGCPSLDQLGPDFLWRNDWTQNR